MGLAGRKVKQRIPNDPRNLSWADDANKFGAAYLQKLGWSSGTGLGTSGEGRTTHVKVHQKLDMLGIGAAHQKDPNGLAWKQSRDFENLLRRLNAAGGEATEDEPGTKLDGFSRATVEEKQDVKEESKKRKRNAEDDGEQAMSEGEDIVVEESKEERKKRKRDEKARKKEEKERKKAEKKKAKETEGMAEDEKVVESTAESSTEPPKHRPTVVRPVRAHRARFMASKNIASKSSTAIDEILGISRSGSATPYPSALDTPALTDPSLSATPADELKLQELTTSSKSVMDYFKEKLLAKSNAASSSGSPSSSSLASTSASMPREQEYDDYDDRPRGLGAGLGFARSSAGGIGASRLRSEVTFEAEECEEPSRAGLGSSVTSQMSAIFSSAKESADAGEVVSETLEVGVVEEQVPEEKRGKKEKKDKGKKCEMAEEIAGEAEEKEKKSKKRKERSGEDAMEEVSEEGKKSEHRTPGGEGEDVEEEDGENASSVARKKKSKKDKMKEAKVEVEGAAEMAGREKKKKKSKKAKPSDS